MTTHGEDLKQATQVQGDEVEAALAIGDKRRALTLLMARHGEGVYRFALAMTGDHHTADDVRQQVFVEAYRDLGRFAGRSSVQTWLYGIARHRCLDAAKARRRWDHRFKNAPPAEIEIDDREPDREIDRNRLAGILATCLAKLAPAAREAVVLRYHHELSYDEAAAIAGDRAGTLQQRVARALRVLRRYIEAELCAGESG